MSKKILCTKISNGKCHDFSLFKVSKLRIHPSIQVVTDSGYQGLQKHHRNAVIPKKGSKKRPLSKEEKKKNREISSYRALNENVIRRVKRFKIVSDRYRNRRKRFGLRFNLISGICNLELSLSS